MLHDVPQSSGLGRVAKFIRRRYVPCLLKPFVKGFVLVGFFGIFVLSVISIQHIQLGLGTQFRVVVPNLQLTAPFFRPEARITIGIIPRQVFRGSGGIPGRWPTCLFRNTGRRSDGSCRSATLVWSFHHLRRLLRGKCTGIGTTTTQELVVHRRAYCLVDRRLPSMVRPVEGVLLSRAQAQPSHILSGHGPGTTLPALF
jgi:hypothetical protein